MGVFTSRFNSAMAELTRQDVAKNNESFKFYRDLLPRPGLGKFRR